MREKIAAMMGSYANYVRECGMLRQQPDPKVKDDFINRFLSALAEEGEVLTILSSKLAELNLVNFGETGPVKDDAKEILSLLTAKFEAEKLKIDLEWQKQMIKLGFNLKTKFETEKAEGIELISMLKEIGHIQRRGVTVEWDKERNKWISYQPTFTSKEVLSDSITEALKVNPRDLDGSLASPAGKEG